MKIYHLYAAVCAAFLFLAGCGSRYDGVPGKDLYNVLWYETPASIWKETLPLGNGRLGMMPDGGLDEHIVLNDISLWSGSEADYSNPEAGKTLPAIRKLLYGGKNVEAQELMYTSFLPAKSPGTFGSYQVLGFLDLKFGQADAEISNYRRWLDLENAVAFTEYTADGIDYGREYFVSMDKDVMLVHISSGRKGTLNFTASLERPERFNVRADGSTLIMEGALDSGRPEVDGIVSASDGGLELCGGKDAWIVLSCRHPIHK